MSNPATARNIYDLPPLHKFISRVTLSYLAFAVSPLFAHIQQLLCRLDLHGFVDITSWLHSQVLIHGIASLSTPYSTLSLYLPSRLRYKVELHTPGTTAWLPKTLCKGNWRNTIRSNFNLRKGKAGGEGNKVSTWGEWDKGLFGVGLW